jgi:hypothetical protein
MNPVKVWPASRNSAYNTPFGALFFFQTMKCVVLLHTQGPEWPRAEAVLCGACSHVSRDPRQLHALAGTAAAGGAARPGGSAQPSSASASCVGRGTGLFS